MIYIVMGAYTPQMQEMPKYGHSSCQIQKANRPVEKTTQVITFDDMESPEAVRYMNLVFSEIFSNQNVVNSRDN